MRSLALVGYETGCSICQYIVAARGRVKIIPEKERVRIDREPLRRMFDVDERIR